MEKEQNYGLSKSKVAAFEQCARRLWLQKHAPERAVTDPSREAIFASGHAVGELACELEPNGIMVEIDDGMQTAIALTQELITAADRPIFEATFAHNGVLVRVDILIPLTLQDGGGKTAWHIAEVKSSTKAKPEHQGDLATQLWVLRECGLNVASAAIRHIDNSFTLKTYGNYDGMFADSELLAEIEAIVATRSETVVAARKVLNGPEPSIATGAHCSTPYDCEFFEYCREQEQEGPEHPLTDLPNSGKKLAAKWANEDIFDIRDLPQDAGLNPLHSRIWDSLVNSQTWRDRDGVLAATADWKYPRIWLDFESANFAIPRWLGTRPYQQVPFQFSAHIEQDDGSISHVEHLDTSGDDPRPGIAAALTALPAEGAVIAWFASFERSRLKELADDFPEFANALTSLRDRTVDLLPVTRNHYYHPDQRGSFSIKKVLPTIAPHMDYGELEVGDGSNAVVAFEEAISPDCSSERRAELRAQLLRYCANDTMAMIEIYRGLTNGQED